MITKSDIPVTFRELPIGSPLIKLSNDFKCQLMTSFCLQLIRILYNNNDNNNDNK